MIKAIFFTLALAFSLSAKAVEFKIDLTPPPGTVTMFSGKIAPDGWMLAQGQVLAKADYPALAAVIECNFTCPDADHFKLPDTQGLFVRGSGSQVLNGLGYDGGPVGNSQNDQFQGHVHATGGYVYIANTSDGLSNTSIHSNPTSNFSSGPLNDGVHGDPRVGSETRPANLTMNYIIKL